MSGLASSWIFCFPSILFYICPKYKYLHLTLSLLKVLNDDLNPEDNTYHFQLAV